MNPPTYEQARDLFASIGRTLKKISKVTVVIASPAVFISLLGKKMISSAQGIRLSAQDVSEHPEGAFTGSISARQVASAGAQYVILGHSERRALGDTDAIVAKKVRQALDAGLRIILCVGESERDLHAHYLQYIRTQIMTVLTGLDKKLIRNFIVAYEPVWAIGKSYDVAPKPADIHEMSIYIKKIISEIIGKNSAMKVPVLYGGSVNAENAQAILKDARVDGLLVGRQSLDAKAFNDMISYANSL